MRNPSLLQLAFEAERAFAFLKPAYELDSVEFFGPYRSFRSGFQLRFSGEGQLSLRYFDRIEFEIELNGQEVFGANKHSGFAGNQFSPQHLSDQLQQIAKAVSPSLLPGERHAI